MKLFEVTITDEKITIRRESEEHLNVEQKFILLALLPSFVDFILDNSFRILQNRRVV